MTESKGHSVARKAQEQETGRAQSQPCDVEPQKLHADFDAEPSAEGGSGGDLYELAYAVHRGRFPSDREPTPFGEAGVSDTAYCYRIAKSVASLMARKVKEQGGDGRPLESAIIALYAKPQATWSAAECELMARWQRLSAPSTEPHPVAAPESAVGEGGGSVRTALLGPSWRVMTREELPMLLPRGFVLVKLGPDDTCDVWLADELQVHLSTEAQPSGCERSEQGNPSQAEPIMTPKPALSTPPPPLSSSAGRAGNAGDGPKTGGQAGGGEP